MASELSVALRIQAFLDQAKVAVRGFRTDVGELGTVGKTSGQALNEVGGARTVSNLNSTAASVRNARTELTRMSDSVQLITKAWIAFQAVRGVANTASAMFGVSDQATQLASRMKLATDSTQEMHDAQEQLYRISNDLQVPLAASTSLFARLNPVVKQLNGSYNDTLKINYGLAAALKVSGASTEEQASSILQFAQALGSGVLAGDEFKSLAESSPRLMQIIADSLNVPRGALKQMASDGKLTAAVIGNALVQSFSKMKGEVASFGPTVGGSMTQLSNAYLKWTQDSENANGTARGTANLIRSVANNFDTAATVVISAVTATAAIIASRAIGSLTSYVVSMVAARAAMMAEAQTGLAAAEAENVLAAARLRAAQAGAGAATGAMSLVAAQSAATASATTLAAAQGRMAGLAVGVGGALRGILGLLGGPVGIVVTLGIAAAAWLNFGNAAKQGSETAEQELARLRNQAAQAPASKVKGYTAEIVTLGAQITDLQGKQTKAGSGSEYAGILDAQIKALQDKQKTYAELIARTGGIDPNAPMAEVAGTLRDDPKVQLEKLRKDLMGRVQIEKEYQENLTKIRNTFKASISAENDPAKQAALATEQSEAIAQLGEKRAASLAGLSKSAFDRAKADAQLSKAQLEANLSLLEDSISRGNAVVEQAVKDGNVSIDAAYQARLSGLESQSAAQRKVLEVERAELQRALAKAAKPEERTGIEASLAQIDVRIKLLQPSLDEAKRVLGIWKTDQERELATITAKIRVDVAGITGKFDRSAFEQQLKLQSEADYKRIGGLADPADAERQRANLDLLIANGVAQAEINARLQDAQRIQQQLAVAEEAINVEQQSGQISQIEAEARIKAAREAQLPALREIVEQLRQMREALPAEAAAAIDQATVSIGQLHNQVQAATPVIVDFGTRARNTAIDGLADAAGNAVTNFENMGDTIRSTLKQIAGDILRSNIKRILTDQFTPDGGGGGGGSGLFGAVVSGVGKIFGFADGGHIRGPGTGTSDSIPAIVDGKRPIAVSNNEFIQPERSVKHYGLGFMEAIRTLQFPKPRFAFGGLIQAHQAARFATGGAIKAAAGGAAPAVAITFVNQGTPQRVVEQQQTMNGKDVVVSVVLADLSNGGPISRGMRGALARSGG